MKKFAIALFLGLFAVVAAPLMADPAVVVVTHPMHRHHHRRIFIRHRHHHVDHAVVVVHP
jgi:hypothetical protein